MQAYRVGETPSTTWAWKLTKIGDRPPGQGTSNSTAAKRRSRTSGLSTREPLRLELVYRGGAEDSWLVRLDGGGWWRIPGWLCCSDMARQMAMQRVQ
jgi:hypothetical protein